jgi:hypothetical protein
VAVHMRRAAAIQSGAVSALCAVLQAGTAGSVPVALDDVLRALYALAASDSSGCSTTELFASGGVHALVTTACSGDHKLLIMSSLNFGSCPQRLFQVVA